MSGNDYRDICKENPFLKKQQLWDLKKGLGANYGFKEKINYGKTQQEIRHEPTLLASNSESYYTDCKIEIEEPPQLRAYVQKCVPKETANDNKFFTELKITKRPHRCFLELD